MKMKEYLLTLCTVALLAAGCSKDPELVAPAAPQAERCFAVAIAGEPLSRTTISGPDDSNHYPMQWSDADSIGVYVIGTDGQEIQRNRRFKYDAVNNTFEGNFAYKNYTGDVKIYAYYPYRSNNDENTYDKVAMEVSSSGQTHTPTSIGDCYLLVSDAIESTYAEPKENSTEVWGRGLQFTFPASKQPLGVLRIELPASTAQMHTNADGTQEEDWFLNAILFDGSDNGILTRLVGHYTVDLANPEITEENTFNTYSEIGVILENGTEKIRVSEGCSIYLTALPCTIQTVCLAVRTKVGEVIVRSSKSLTIKPGCVSTLKVPMTRFKQGRDLNLRGTANCYVIPTNTKRNHFDATVRGNGVDYENPAQTAGKTLNGALSTYSAKLTGADSVTSAKLLWAHSPEDGAVNTEIVQNVEYKDGSIYFDTGKWQGNALIAGLNASGAICWSWHIWVNNDAVKINLRTHVTDNTHMMYRNLGAVNNDPTADAAYVRGLYYQWGRKDPFLPNLTGDKSTKGSIEGSTWILEKDQIEADGSSMLAKTIAHPMTYYSMSASYPKPPTTSSPANDWYTTNVDATVYNLLWGAGVADRENPCQYVSDTKTIFDPCPVGYRMPPAGIWGQGEADKNLHNIGGTDYWMNFGTETSVEFLKEQGSGLKGAYFMRDHEDNAVGYAYYPAVGAYQKCTWQGTEELRYWSGSTTNPEKEANNHLKQWAGTTYITSTLCQPDNFYYRQDGRPVRCVSEQYFKEHASSLK